MIADGLGTTRMQVTEETLLNPNRNPNLTKEQIEGYLKEYLNVQKVGHWVFGRHACLGCV